MGHLITNESCAAHYRGQASCGWPECTIRERIALIVKGREAGTVGARAQCRSAATTRVRRPSHLVPTPSCTFLPCRVWNGIFAAGDWRAKKDLKTMSLRRDRKSETTTREKWPQKRLFCSPAISCGFRKTGWWRRQSEANRSLSQNSLFPRLTGIFLGKIIGSYHRIMPVAEGLLPNRHGPAEPR